MNLHVDIYQCAKGHIHVSLRGDAVGLAAFDDSQVFAKFVSLCQDFIKKGDRPETIMEWLIEQNFRYDPPIPEAFLDAFDDDWSLEW